MRCMQLACITCYQRDGYNILIPTNYLLIWAEKRREDWKIYWIVEIYEKYICLEFSTILNNITAYKNIKNDYSHQVNIIQEFQILRK